MSCDVFAPAVSPWMRVIQKEKDVEALVKNLGQKGYAVLWDLPNFTARCRGPEPMHMGSNIGTTLVGCKVKVLVTACSLGV